MTYIDLRVLRAFVEGFVAMLTFQLLILASALTLDRWVYSFRFDLSSPYFMPLLIAALGVLSLLILTVRFRRGIVSALKLFATTSDRHQENAS